MADRAQESSGYVFVRQVLNDRYRIMKELGHGRYSIVWLAKDRV